MSGFEKLVSTGFPWQTAHPAKTKDYRTAPLRESPPSAHDKILRADLALSKPDMV